MKKYEKPYTGKIHRGCLNCSTAPTAGEDEIALAPLDMLIAVGFGMACVTRDREMIYDEMEAERAGRRLWTVRDAERRARKYPHSDWRITKHGPMHGEVFQRQGPNRWVLISSDQGFA